MLQQSPTPKLRNATMSAVCLKTSLVLLIEATGLNLKFKTRQMGSSASTSTKTGVIAINIGLLLIAKEANLLRW